MQEGCRAKKQREKTEVKRIPLERDLVPRKGKSLGGEKLLKPRDMKAVL